MAWCYGSCGKSTTDDACPWLLITGWRRYVPLAVLLCPECEEGAAHLGDELHDLMGVRLPDNGDPAVGMALRGWPTLPTTRAGT